MKSGEYLVPISIVLEVILGALISAIITGIIGVYTYLPRYQLSKAIFFEELAYYRYDHHQTYGGDENHV